MDDGWVEASSLSLDRVLRSARMPWDVASQPSRPLCVLYASKIDAADRAGRIALLQHTIYSKMELFCRI